MIDPKCLNGDKDYGWSSEGFLLPCCWQDVREKYKEEIKYLMKDNLHISNVNSIEEIINSEEWKFFYSSVDNNTCCNFYCGTNSKVHKVCEKKL
jgi:hypothetical protein